MKTSLSLIFVILLPKTSYWFTPKPIEMKYTTVLLLLVMSISGKSQTVQDFTLTNVVDGKAVSLSGFKNCQGIAVIFTSNECPFDVQYRDRIRELNEQYKGTIQFLLVNSHLEPRENNKAMAQKFSSWSIPVPYLADKDQTALDCLGASRSPEAFLIKKNGANHTIVYRGAIDDNPLVSGDVNNSFLKMAIDQLLANKPIEIGNKRAAGCTIRKK